MKTILLAAALLASAALPAWAAQPCGADPLPACDYDDVDVPPQKAVTMGTLPQNEKNCVYDRAGYDLKRYGIHGEAEAISDCDIPIEHVGAAMDFLMLGLYAPRSGPLATAWVEAHCRAEAAIPHNKWVCTEPYGTVTREYR